MIKDNKIEKQILRDAFCDYLPNDILYRQKEQFSDGVGYNWIDTLKDITIKRYQMIYLKMQNINSPSKHPKQKKNITTEIFSLNIFPLIQQL